MAHNLDEFWEILKAIQNEPNDLTEAIEAIAKNEKTTSQRFIDVVVDQIAYNSPDWARLRNFFRDWYAALRTVTGFQANISDVYQMPNDQLDELFRSFGYELSAFLKDPTNNEAPTLKVNFFLDLVNLYKRKGTPQALVDVLQYYGITEVDIYEFQLKFEERDRKDKTELIFEGKVTAGTSDDKTSIYLPFEFLTDRDPHWLQSESHIRNLVTTNKINFPSQSPYFGVKPLFDEEATDAATGILVRHVQDQYAVWNTAGRPDEGLIAVLPQNAVITILGETVSMLTLYLASVYTFNKEFNVGAPASRFVCYDGINTESIDIIQEFRDITGKVFTRDEWKIQWDLYIDTFSRPITSNFLQKHDGPYKSAERYLSILHPSVKTSLDNLTSDNITVLGTLLRDLGEWVRNNISFGFINMSYILFGLDSFFAELSDVIEFFKPYRARLIPIETIEFNNRLFNSIIVEDSFLMDINQDVHDFVTGDGIPCCTEQSIDSTSPIDVCLDSTSNLYYARDTYDCGSWFDIGAVTDITQEMFIEFDDTIIESLRCPAYYGDGTAAIHAASWLDAPNAPIVTSNLLDYLPMEFDIVNVDASSTVVTGLLNEAQATLDYALTLNMFNEDDAIPSIYSYIITDKTLTSFTAKFSDAMDSANYSVAYDYDRTPGNFGRKLLSDGTNIVTVSVFPSEAIDSTAYTVSLSLFNDTDSNPSLYNYSVIERTPTSFTVQFSGDIDSPNYYLEWIIISHDKQDVIPVSPGSTSFTVPLQPNEVNDSYGLSVTLLNTLDATSSIIPFIITDKSINGFTVTFDSPIDSPNYELMWSRPIGTSLVPDEYKYYQSGGFANFDGVPAWDGTAYTYVEGTEGRFDCTHGFDLVQIEIEDSIEFLLQENGDYLLQQDDSRIYL